MSRLLPIAKRGEPILQQRAQEVTDIHDPTIQALIDDMLTTMLEAGGIGIAAPQVFISQRIIIVASRPNPRYPDAPLMEPVAMLNPEILWLSADTCTGWEGCLSVPDARAPVPRANNLRLRYLTRWGESVETEYTGFIARIIQHECDHLDGILFPERVGDKQKIVSEAEFQQVSRARE
ncbi:MAG: peptide deformylase [Gammaproteobacteria bacterium]|nr:peptide deformylase [Gammaproteobacteria bacterium]MBU1723623.1 peptide deformylase [Gammaproteobacteria bacterium]MBU2004288.1 peptide deformylase [Gammaproteobacteria bacterium]